MISAEYLSFSWSTEPLLQEVSLHIPEAAMTVIVGPNGAGKSTLLKLFCGILRPQSGMIKIGTRNLSDIPQKALARLIGYVPQHFSTAFDFRSRDIVAMGRYAFQSPFSPESKEDRRQIRIAMEETGVWEMRDRRISELSGGERQRLILASTLAQQPQILLLDEPTTAMDIKHQLQFLQLLRQLREDKSLTIVTVTHDVNLAVRFFDRMLVMKQGRIAADGAPANILTPELLQEVYDVQLEIFPHPKDGKPLLLLP